MAKTQQQQLLVILMTISLVVVSLLMKLDSVSASSVPLDGNENSMLQQQHIDDNNEEEHNFIMEPFPQKSSTIVPKRTDNLEDGDDGDILNGNNLRNELPGNQLSFSHPYDPITMVKRAPSGFVGMRGKKLYYEDDNIENDSDNDNSIALPWSQIQNSDEAITWDEYTKPNIIRYKKAPTAFYGVRGKKFATINGVNPSNSNQRWQEYLQKLEEDRVRDAMLQDFVERLASPRNDLSNEMAKRAPTGFTGVRGKRPSIDDVESSMENLTKRGLGTNAFVGVRGKKDVSHQTFKRSPMGAERYFFDFWKKSSPVGSGKRHRFVDFNNKFVAVRGKKNSYDSMDAFNTLNKDRTPSSDTINLIYGKRAPNGFLGMRGKRPFTSGDILSVN